MRVLHSGDFGDIVYALAAMRARCVIDKSKCEIFLTPSRATREPMTLERAHSIGDLLMMQPWVQRWKFLPSEPTWNVDYDFDLWRAGYKSPENLGESQAKFMGIDPVCLRLPWLHVTPATKINVLVARSHRYRNPEFPWKEIAAKLNRSAVCVGTQSEWEELSHQFDFKQRAVVNTVGDLARVVASAELVVTNQTLVRAIAEGLKKPVFFERWPEHPNVDFDRNSVVHEREKILEKLGEMQ